MRSESGQKRDSLSNLRRAVNTGLETPMSIISRDEYEEIQELLDEEEE